MDLIAIHLDAPTGLIENRTASADAWIQLRLVGTTSERDAHFGLANSVSVEVEVKWPSGQSDQLRMDQLNQRWLINEGDEFAHDDRWPNHSMNKDLRQ